jgi:hypothetical protein
VNRDDDQPLPRWPRLARMADTFIGPEIGTIPTPSGYVIDGAVYGLEGQPPPATSKGWGNLSWLRRWY